MTSPVPDIRLPTDLLPCDGRFGAGPSKIRPEALATLVAASPTYLGTSHRQRPVRAMVGRLRSGLRELFSLPDGYEVVLGNGGAALFWDVATVSLIERRSQHLSFGQFSASFADTVAAAPHLEAPDVREAPPGSAPEARPGPGIDAYALTHNETSTGVAVPVTRPDGADPAALVLVDATSAAGGMPVDPPAFDVYYFAPQKGLGSDGGLWLALCSPAAVERAERIAASGRWIPAGLSLALALENARLDQTYNTPALATLLLATDQVEWILAQGGLAWAAARCQSSADAIYRWAEGSSFARPFVEDPALRSPVVATIDFADTIDAATVAAVLRANGIVDTEPYRRLGRNQLRIGMYPAVDPADVRVLTAAVDHVVEALAGPAGDPQP